MELNQLNYFRTVAKHENVTKAAEELFISQPNLSTSISRLEASLGVMLFERKKGRIKLTRNGEVFLTHVNRIFEELDSAKAAIQEQEVYKEDKIAAGASFGCLMPLLFDRYFMSYGLVPTEQIYGSQAFLEEKLHKQELDLAILNRKPEDPELEWLPVCEDRLVALVKHDNPLAVMDSTDLSAFRKEHFICNELYLDRMILEQVCKQAGFVSIVVRTANEKEIFCDSTFDFGKNVVLIPSHFVSVLSAEALLEAKVIPLRDYFAKVTVGVAHLKSRPLPPIVAEFYEYASKEIKTIIMDDAQYARSIIQGQRA